MVIRNGLFGLAALLVLAACAPVDVTLPGERQDIRAPFGQAENTENRTAPIHLARAVNHTSWPQRAGNASHSIANAAFATTPSALWTASIGQGNDRRHRITADPVAADGRIFTLDSRATVSATSSAGATLWSRDLTPPSDNPDDASGGGLAVVDGTLFVTTGFGDLIALSAATGTVIWTQRLDAPATGAPTVKGGLVYVVTRDGRAWAIRVDNGRVRWQVAGTPSVSGIVGGSGPAVGAGRVFFPFGSAQIVAAFPKGGLKIWSASVAGERLGRAYAQLSDVTGDPVVVGNTVYAGNPSGRTVALNAATGETRWTAREGAVGPVVVAGGSVFLISDRAQLVRLKSSNGRRIWASQLPDFQPARNPRRQRDVYAHFGPVLAGGRLWVASGDGQLRSFDPVNGNQVVSVALPGGGTTRPIVVDGVMYVVSGDGQLMAFR
jgi:outer membrane protein assembly factor BamB